MTNVLKAWPTSVLSFPSARMTLIALAVSLMTPLGGSELFGQAQVSQNLRIALGKAPRQKGVDVDSVEPADFAKCKEIDAAEHYGGKGFIAVGPNDQFLRMYVRDGGGTYWTFFKDGQEVYQEIDSNNDRRIDQYRWMGNAGMRWGVDQNQDGTIDSWKAISAQEVASEAFESFRNNDQARYLRLALRNDDLQQLALGPKAQTKVVAEVNKLRQGIANTLASEKVISASTEYLNFGGVNPSTVPKGKMGMGKDIVIYDNGSAIFKSGSKIHTIQLGTMIQVGDRWRIAQLPVLADDETAGSAGGLFRLPSRTPTIVGPGTDKLMTAYSKADKALRSANARRKEALHKERFDIMLKIIAAREGEDKDLWVKMIATDASIAFSSNEYTGGKKLLQMLAKSEITENHHDLFAWELVNLNGASTDDNLALLDAMEAFVTAYPDSEHSKEAYRQLGLFSEYDSSPVETSVKWYKEITTRFPDSPEAAFAAGAIKRLTSFGELLDFRGETFSKQKFSLAAYRGKRMVVLHYWSTTDELSLADFEGLIALRAKHKDELSVIGVNLDENMATATAYLKSSQPGAKWPHLWAEGARATNPLALQLGIISVPSTFLINKRGELAENQITVGELDREIYRLKRRER